MKIISTWIVKPQSFIDTVDKDLSKIVADLATKVYDGVVDNTPVWTGRARNCWTMNADSPVFKSIPLKDVGQLSVLPRPITPSLSGSMAKRLVYICNGQPYSGVLEHGGPHNAPVGMVRTTIAGLKV
jgi:hypothetical protein